MKNIEIYSLIAAYLYIILAIVISKITGIKKKRWYFCQALGWQFSYY